MTVAEAKALVEAHKDEGSHCPVCGQLAKTYRRSIHTSMAVALIKVYRKARFAVCYIPDVLSERESADFAKLRYWGLIQPVEGEREDGSNRNGMWQVTLKGARFIRGDITCQKTVLVFDSEPQGFEGSRVSIHDALHNHFDYDELMAGVQ